MPIPPVPPEMKRLEPFEHTLRDVGMSYPEVTEDFPWGHRTLKVKGKAFVFFSLSEKGFTLSVKLPDSHGAALMLPFVEPTGYGLGKSGWVTARFGARDTPPVPMLSQWLVESYRAVAPKKLGALLDGAPVAQKPVAQKPVAQKPVAQKPVAQKKTAAKKTGVRKTAAKKAPASPRARRA